jgi:hypothetical protein
MHDTVNSKAVGDTVQGSRRRKSFCRRRIVALSKFPFTQLSDNVLAAVDLSSLEIRDLHLRFFCVLCDAANHRFLNVTSTPPSATFDLLFCKQHLRTHADALGLLNIQLTDYLTLLQQVVDCRHYSTVYQLPFINAAKVRRAHQIRLCLRFIDTPRFYRHCRSTCEHISLAAVNPETLGDFDFLDEFIDVLHANFERPDTEYMQDPRLRAFWHRLQSESAPLSSYSSRGRMLSVIAPTHILPSTKAFEAVTPHLSSQSKVNSRQRSLASPLAIDSNALSFYAEIDESASVRATHIWPLAPRPIDFDRIAKVFQANIGINPAKYRVDFAGPSSVFYERLFAKRRVERTNAEVEFLLSEFNDVLWEQVDSDLNDEFIFEQPATVDDTIRSPSPPTFFQRLAAFLSFN